MKKRRVIAILISLSVMLISSAALGQIRLAEKNIQLINEAVFEVVIQKPVIDSLTYAKVLPFENIPFAERNDKYISVGTAFAISDTQYISAAHVVSLESETQNNEIYIRDNNKNVFELDSVTKYSYDKDFVVFTVKNRESSVHLSFSGKKSVPLNTAVYAVGNAYGEGVIIRDGTLTSKTPEEENGRWEWLRFSVAASPGNSGGPLLDADGDVIGVILRKSENENLNYAIPASLITDFPNNQAEYHTRFRYELPNSDRSASDVFNKITALPMNYQTLRNEMSGFSHEISRKVMNKLIIEQSDNIFPNGTGSQLLLNKVTASVFPALIGEGEDGNWDIYTPEKKENSSLGDNGYIDYGTMGNVEYAYFQNPDGISLKDIIDDSKKYMDLYLKGSPFTRSVGGGKNKYHFDG